MYIKYSILILIITYNICLCRPEQKKYTLSNNLQYEKLYLSAKKMLQNSNYQDAIKILEILKKKYPFHSYNNQVHFNLIYAYYKSMNFISTQDTINNFIRFNPHHPNLDYLLYIQGLTNMELDDNHSLIQKLLKINYFKKNPIYAEEAFQNFVQLIHKYPNSQYIADAQKRLIYLKNRIAEYELFIIDYYYKKQAYIAVINRTEDMLRYFSDTKATYKALLYMHNAYQKVQLLNQANTIMKIINYNKK